MWHYPVLKQVTSMKKTNNHPTVTGITLATVALICAALLAGPLAVKKGMSEQDVDALLGPAARVEQVGNSTALLYKKHEFVGFGWRTVDYPVVISGGEVTDYGAGALQRLGHPHE